MKYILLILFLSFSGAYAQRHVLITVVDANTNEILPAASIRVDEAGYHTSSNYEGVTVLQFNSPGSYTLSISHIGYFTERYLLKVTEADSQKVIVPLDQSVLPLPEVEISATRGSYRYAPITVSNIPQEELSLKSAVTDLPSLMSSLPSVNFYSEGGNSLGYTYIRIRGFDQRRISVLINGIPQNDPEDHNVYWINFYDLASSLQDVQVQRGAGSALYGPPAIGGSINMVTKIPDAVPSAQFEYSYGSYNTRKFSLSLSSGSVADHFIFSGRITRAESDGYRDWSWSKFWRFFFHSIYYDKNQSLQLFVYGGPQEDGLAFYGIPKAYNGDPALRKTNYGSILKDREYFHQPQFSLVHDYAFSEAVILRNSIFYISGNGFFDFDASWGTTGYFRMDSSLTIPSDAVMRSAVDNDQFGWLPQIDWKQPFGRFIAGAELRRHRSLHWGRLESASGIPKQYIGEEGDYHFYEYRGGKDVFAWYLGQLINFDEMISLNTDVQFVYQTYSLFGEKFVNTDFTTPYFFINPKLGVNVSLSSSLSLYGSLAYTQREPPLKNLYEAESASWGVVPQFKTNPDGTFDFSSPFVNPEKLLDIETGVRFFSSAFRLSAVLFYMDFRDEIVPSGGVDMFGQPRVGNAEHTRHMGIEIESAFRLFPGLDLFANLSLSDNRFIAFTEYDSEGTPSDREGNFIANAPEFLMNTGVSYSGENISASLLVQHTGVQYADNTQHPGASVIDINTVEAFTVAHVYLSYKIPITGVNISIGSEIHNLFDTKYMAVAFGRDNYFPAAERSILFTIKAFI